VKRWTLSSLVVLGVLLFARGETNVSSPQPTLEATSGSTGSAVPAKAAYMGANASGNLAGIVICDKSAFITPNTATTTQIVALVSAQTIYVCSYSVSFLGSATANTGIFKYGTGSSCGTGTTSLSATLQGPTATGSGTVVTRGSGIGYLMKTASATALCFTTSAAVAVGVDVTYTQF
jgi:hypothetical protein